MAKKTTDILSSWFRSNVKPRLLNVINTLAISIKIRLSFIARSTVSYSHIVRGNIYEAIIGGKMIEEFLHLPDLFQTQQQLKPYGTDMIKALMALGLHEIGHPLFTDMTDPIIINYPKQEYVVFLQELNNIIEDPVEENALSALHQKLLPYHTNPRYYFNFLKEKIFDEQAAQYKDDGTVGSFLLYLLLLVRCGYTNIPNQNAVYEKYRSSLAPMIKDCLTEPDANKRLHKNVALGEWMIDNITELDFSKVPQQTQPISGSMAGNNGAPTPNAAGGGGSIPGANNNGGTGSDGSEGEGGGGESGGGEQEEQGGRGGTGGNPRSSGEIENNPLDVDVPPAEDNISNEEFSNIFDDDCHTWIVAKDTFEIVDNKIYEKVDEHVSQFGKAISDVSKFLTMIKGRRQPRMTTGFTSGKLNIREAMANDICNKCNTHIFMKKVDSGKGADPVVCLVTDNSGSMNGDKSILATQASLVLCKACELVNVPVSYYSFCTNREGVTTFIIKSFEDSFEKSKPFFALTDSHLDKALSTDDPIASNRFSSNIDEINLKYIGAKLSKDPHKTKIMIVMSDGMTCGSDLELADTVKELSEKGITVIGVGICSNSVLGIYPTVKVFNSTEQLKEGLAPYLIDTLTSFVA